MSARAVSLWFIDSDDPVALLGSTPANDVVAAQKLAEAIYGDRVLVPIVDTDLATAAAAQDPHVYAGWYGRLAVITCSLFAANQPSTLTRTIASIRQSAAATLLYTDPETSVGAFARWENGELRRSFAADPVTILEDNGLPFPLERPFWGGEHPLRYAPGIPAEPLALPFHPQELAEESNRAWLGFRFTRPFGENDLDPARIPVTAFAIHPADYIPAEADWARYQHSKNVGTPGAGSAAPNPVDAEPSPVRRRGRIARYFGFG
ncbi:DUF6928 family protein [Gordonia insulae]|uniref:Uncharacterized protein n=1 Tax=Gordonia insulae TaxID=2420509 RepID=A0A3G8JJV9_9ACTN|nr:hypothetical protein [Gordonia insulae]AZG45371.1 hypothetical protein D7316_01967 [Gordonia insulae]